MIFIYKNTIILIYITKNTKEISKMIISGLFYKHLVRFLMILRNIFMLNNNELFYFFKYWHIDETICFVSFVKKILFEFRI